MGDELVRDVYERLGKIEAKIDDVREIRVKAEGAEDIANKALDSSKSAHHRLDKVDKIFWWLGTTVIGAVLVALVALVVKVV